jgi:hypothetical protein
MVDQPEMEVIQPAGYETTGAPRQSNTGLILLIIVLVLFFMCCCCLFLLVAGMVWGAASLMWNFGDYFFTGVSALGLIVG